MERVAFRLRVRTERIREYEEADRRVWSELLRPLKAAGVEQYSFFRRGQDLFLSGLASL